MVQVGFNQVLPIISIPLCVANNGNVMGYLGAVMQDGVTMLIFFSFHFLWAPKDKYRYAEYICVFLFSILWIHKPHCNFHS